MNTIDAKFIQTLCFWKPQGIFLKIKYEICLSRRQIGKWTGWFYFTFEPDLKIGRFKKKKSNHKNEFLKDIVSWFQIKSRSGVGESKKPDWLGNECNVGVKGSNFRAASSNFFS